MNAAAAPTPSTTSTSVANKDLAGLPVADGNVGGLSRPPICVGGRFPVRVGKDPAFKPIPGTPVGQLLPADHAGSIGSAARTRE